MIPNENNMIGDAPIIDRNKPEKHEQINNKMYFI